MRPEPDWSAMRAETVYEQDVIFQQSRLQVARATPSRPPSDGKAHHRGGDRALPLFALCEACERGELEEAVHASLVVESPSTLPRSESA